MDPNTLIEGGILVVSIIIAIDVKKIAGTVRGGNAPGEGPSLNTTSAPPDDPQGDK